jgi:hypothetical protein
MHSSIELSRKNAAQNSLARLITGSNSEHSFCNIHIHDDKEQNDVPLNAETFCFPPELICSTRQMVELNGIEPMTSCLQSRRSPN